MTALLPAEADFNAWREAVIAHVLELLAGDCRQETNHSRLRDRLLALASLLPGAVPAVKERQFRIGYEVERLQGLLAAYQSGGDDMPILNAAVLEDVKQLLLALKMGVDKLERWAEFRRLAVNDAMKVADVDRPAVSEALEEMAATMAQQPKYFDPELPSTFRFLSEAVRDPIGATQSVVFGAVKSAENLISFLGQRALGIVTRGVDGPSKITSRRQWQYPWFQVCPWLLHSCLEHYRRPGRG